MRRANTLAAVSGFLTLLLFPSLAPAQTSQGVGVVSTMSGRATVARTALAQPLPLEFKDSVFDRDRISTAENATVRVLMGGKALVTIRELSTLTMTEDMTRSTVDLQSGKIAVSVLRQRMRPGEAIEIRTHNAVAAVRGTVLVVEIIQASTEAGVGPVAAGATAPTTNIHVLHGSVDVRPANVPGGATIAVGAFQTYTQVGNVLGSLHPLTQSGMTQLMSNLKSGPQFGQGTGGAMDQVTSKEQARASTEPAKLDGAGLLPGGNSAPPTGRQSAPITPPKGPPTPPRPITVGIPANLTPPPPGCGVAICSKGGNW